MKSNSIPWACFIFHIVHTHDVSKQIHWEKNLSIGLKMLWNNWFISQLCVHRDMSHLESLPGATLTHLSCSRCFFGFPRQELSFGFLPSSLTFWFFLQCVFSYFWVWGVSSNFLKILILIKNLAQIFAYFCKIHFIFLIHCSNVYVPEWI